MKMATRCHLLAFRDCEEKSSEKESKKYPVYIWHRSISLWSLYCFNSDISHPDIIHTVGCWEIPVGIRSPSPRLYIHLPLSYYIESKHHIIYIYTSIIFPNWPISFWLVKSSREISIAPQLYFPFVEYFHLFHLRWNEKKETSYHYQNLCRTLKKSYFSFDPPSVQSVLS